MSRYPKKPKNVGKPTPPADAIIYAAVHDYFLGTIKNENDLAAQLGITGSQIKPYLNKYQRLKSVIRERMREEGGAVTTKAALKTAIQAQAAQYFPNPVYTVDDIVDAWLDRETTSGTVAAFKTKHNL